MVVKRSGLFLVGILILSSFASAGLFEWFGNITGKATSGTAALNITVGNNAPTISGITFISAQTPTESGAKTVIFNFNVTDADGASNLNDSAAKAEFDNDGEAVRFNNSCVWVRDYAPNTAEYSCSVNMWYFDESGTWYVNVSSADINGAGARDDSTRQFTFNQLTSMVMSPTALGWGALGVANVNVGSNNDPIVVNNMMLMFGMILVSLSMVSAFGVSTPYWDENPLRLAPGESMDVELVLQNMAGSAGGTKLSAGMADDAGGGSRLVDSDLDYFVPFGSDDVKVRVRVAVPMNVVDGGTREVVLSFTQVGQEGAGMVSVSGGFSTKFA